MIQKLEYKPENVFIVPTGSVSYSDYNPKDETPADYPRVKRSIEVNGMMTPIMVRDDPKKKDKYILVDGHQRLRAAIELGYKDVPIYSFGKITEARAKALTVWFQDAKTKFEAVSLAGLVVELVDGGMELPYMDNELAAITSALDIDFDNVKSTEDRKAQDEDADGMTSFHVRLTVEQLGIFNQATRQIMDDNDCSIGRAMELMAADYMSGYQK